MDTMTFLKTILYVPLYNGLVFLISAMPGHDVGLAIIILTMIVRVILFPLGQKAARSQLALRELEPEIKKVKEQYKTKEEQAKKTFELYKKHKVNPFSSCLLALIQLPIIIALYYVFFKGLGFNEDILYSFVQHPETLNFNFLGLIDLGGKSLTLALLAGATQFIQSSISFPKPKHGSTPAGGDFKENFAKSMQMQMKYIFPVMLAFIAYQISGAVALYLIVSNMFMIAQELVVRRQFKKEQVKNHQSHELRGNQK